MAVDEFEVDAGMASAEAGANRSMRSPVGGMACPLAAEVDVGGGLGDEMEPAGVWNGGVSVGRGWDGGSASRLP